MTPALSVTPPMRLAATSLQGRGSSFVEILGWDSSLVKANSDDQVGIGYYMLAVLAVRPLHFGARFPLSAGHAAVAAAKAHLIKPAPMPPQSYAHMPPQGCRALN